MKKYILLAFFACLTVFGQAQINYKGIAEKTCSCIKGKDFSGKSKNEMQMDLGLCMIKAMGDLDVQIDSKEEGFMERVGGEVGKLMISICPNDFMKILNAETKEGSTLMDDIVNEGDEKIQISGSIVKVMNDDMLYIVVKTATNKEVKVLILNHVDNIDSYVETPEKLVGKKVNIQYAEKEYYISKFKEFVKIKELVKLNFE